MMCILVPLRWGTPPNASIPIGCLGYPFLTEVCFIFGPTNTKMLLNSHNEDEHEERRKMQF